MNNSSLAEPNSEPETRQLRGDGKGRPVAGSASNKKKQPSGTRLSSSSTSSDPSPAYSHYEEEERVGPDPEVLQSVAFSDRVEGMQAYPRKASWEKRKHTLSNWFSEGCNQLFDSTAEGAGSVQGCPGSQACDSETWLMEGFTGLEKLLRAELAILFRAHSEKLGEFCASIMTELSSMDRQVRDQLAAFVQVQDHKHDQERSMILGCLGDKDRQWREEVDRLLQYAGGRPESAHYAPPGRVDALDTQLSDKTAAVSKDDTNESRLGRVLGQVQDLHAWFSNEFQKGEENVRQGQDRPLSETLEKLERRFKGVQRRSEHDAPGNTNTEAGNPLTSPGSALVQSGLCLPEEIEMRRRVSDLESEVLAIAAFAGEKRASHSKHTVLPEVPFEYVQPLNYQNRNLARIRLAL